MVIILWAMALWGAAVILTATGYGARDIEKHGLHRLSLVVMGVMVWGLGWWTVGSILPGVRVDLGFLLLAAFGWSLVLAMGNPRWWFIAGLLGVLATIIRVFAPIATHQAQVMPVALIESLGLGTAAGLSLAEAMPAAMVAVSAESLASVLVAWRHVALHDLGRHDLAMVILATLSAWLVGWAASKVVTRLTRVA
ncbi:MAG: hypothetical protein M1272_06790 [Firmicutes bacterium]|nr:hypothetical protein [Bacillota bacterium]